MNHYRVRIRKNTTTYSTLKVTAEDEKDVRREIEEMRQHGDLGEVDSVDIVTIDGLNPTD